MKLSDRIILIRKKFNLTQEEFGKKLGVARNTITGYERNLRTPMEQTIKSICREFNVDYIWFTTGEGEMFSKHSNFYWNELSNKYTLDELDKNLIEAYLNLDDNIKTLFRNYAENLLNPKK